MQFTHEREFTYTRTYQGPVRCVILDWAGTTMDFGCMAPAVVFRQVYEKAGVPISLEEARVPMGAHKRVHIGLISEIPSVRRRWVEKHGTEPTDDDVGRMFDDFVPMQEACLSEYSQLIPGTLEVIAECRKRGYKIGSTSGYLPGMLAINQADAAKQGYEPDATFGAGDVLRGRPFPHMVLRNMLELDISPVQSVVKVDDTLTGIEEGLAQRVDQRRDTLSLSPSIERLDLALDHVMRALRGPAAPWSTRVRSPQRYFARQRSCALAFVAALFADVALRAR